MTASAEGPRPAALVEIHRLCYEFEKLWQSGQRPLIEEYLTRAAETVRDDLLRSLLRSELEIRLDLAEAPTRREYRQRFPDACQSIDVFFDELPSAAPFTSLEGEGRRLRIGHYAILNEIDRGGMGVVYRAFDERLGRHVALKVILTGQLASETEIQRFEIEARAVAMLDHPGIVPVFEVGEWAGHRYLSMPLVEGKNLARLLHDGPLPARQAAEYLRQIALAVQRTHEVGIIHRDLKPRNVLIDKTGRVRITDFGLAKIVGQPLLPDAETVSDCVTRDVTLTGQILGTPDYMSPEQAAGRQGEVGPATDIYSLGAILFEMLAGQPPFKATTLLETIQRIQSSAPPSLCELLPQTSRDLGTVCLKCLEKSPLQRYATAADLVDELERYLSGRAIRARRVSAAGHFWRWSRRNPVLAVLLSVVSLLMAVIAVGSSVAALKLKEEGAAARAAAASAMSAVAERRQELVRVYIAQARLASTGDATDQRRKGTAAIRSALAAIPWTDLKPDLQADLVDAAVPCLTLPSLDELKRIPLDTFHERNDLPQIDIDPALDFVARPAPPLGNTIVQSVGDAADSHEFRTDDRAPNLPAVRQFSPGGRWLLELWYDSAGSTRILVWDRQDHHLALDAVGGRTQHAFSSDERLLLSPDNDNRLRWFDLESGEQVTRSPPRFRSPVPACSPDGRLLAVACPDLPPELTDPRFWQAVEVFTQIGPSSAVVWTPDSARVFFGTLDGKIYACRRESEAWAVELFSQDHTAEVNRLVVSPDGSLLASSDINNVLCIRRVDNSQGQVMIRSSGCVLRFSADSKRLAVLERKHLNLLAIHQSTVVQYLSTTADAAEFSPAGRWLGVSGRQGVQLFAAESLRPVADLELDESGPVAFHPAGKGLITYGKFSQAWMWPLEDEEYLQLGPPHPLLSSSNPSTAALAPQHAGRRVAWDARGERFALGAHRQGKIVVGTVSAGSRDVATIRAPVQVAISPDGRWVAAGGNIDNRVAAWSADDGACVLDIPGQIALAFSSDGKWFATRGREEVQLYRVSTWQRERVVPLYTMRQKTPCPIVFQPDGALLAVSDGDNAVRLYNQETGELVIRLNDRNANPVTWLSFNRDGTRLAVTRPDCVTIWDLRQLRAQLTALGLRAQRLPEAKPPVSDNVSQAIPNLVVDRGDLLRGDQWYTLESRLAAGEAADQRWPDAIDDVNKALRQAPASDLLARARLLALRGQYFSRNLTFPAARDDWQAALELVPDQRTAALELARVYLLGPDNVRDAPRAVPLAAMLADVRETERTGKILLALAHVRLGTTAASDRELLRSARVAAAGTPGEDWRIVAGYVLVLDALAGAHREHAVELFAEAARVDQEQRSSLSVLQQLEVERLQAEVELALQSL